MIILGIDPGCDTSAYLRWDSVAMAPVDFGMVPNAQLEQLLGVLDYDLCVIENIESYGMAVGAEVFRTVFAYGRFSVLSDAPWELVKRVTIKNHHCHNSRATDANIRQALIDRFGPQSVKRETRKTKAGKPVYETVPGPLYGIAKDIWSALAIAVWKADNLGQH